MNGIAAKQTKRAMALVASHGCGERRCDAAVHQAVHDLDPTVPTSFDVRR